MVIKKKTEEEFDSNGDGIAELASLVKLSLKSQQEINERLDEQEHRERQSDIGAANLKLTNMVYDTPNDRLLELTIIPARAPRLLANEIALENIFNPDVQKGKIPLSAIYRNALLRANRSVNGIGIMRANVLARDQLKSSQEDMSGLEQVDL